MADETVLQHAFARVDALKLETAKKVPHGELLDLVTPVLDTVGLPSTVPIEELAAAALEHGRKCMGLVARNGFVTATAFQEIWLEGVAVGLALAAGQADG